VTLRIRHAQPALCHGVLLLAVGCNKDKSSASPLAPAEIESRAPDFELPDLDGKTVKLSSFAGKTVVLKYGS
jgi:cytochrome oxidase Cu insertion factor (SCO1/SenC/PrrC family)